MSHSAQDVTAALTDQQPTSTTSCILSRLRLLGHHPPRDPHASWTSIDPQILNLLLMSYADQEILASQTFIAYERLGRFCLVEWVPPSSVIILRIQAVLYLESHPFPTFITGLLRMGLVLQWRLAAAPGSDWAGSPIFFLKSLLNTLQDAPLVPSLQTGALRLAVGWLYSWGCIKTLLLPLHR